jgi:hypothetical protein
MSGSVCTIWGVLGSAGLGASKWTAAATSPATGLFLLCLPVCLMTLAFIPFEGKAASRGSLCSRGCSNYRRSYVAPAGTQWAITAWCGLLLSILASYSGCCFWRKTLRKGYSPLIFWTEEACSATECDLKDQISKIEKEAGVWKQR